MTPGSIDAFLQELEDLQALNRRHDAARALFDSYAQIVVEFLDSGDALLAERARKAWSEQRAKVEHVKALRDAASRAFQSPPGGGVMTTTPLHELTHDAWRALRKLLEECTYTRLCSSEDRYGTCTDAAHALGCLSARIFVALRTVLA